MLPASGTSVTPAEGLPRSSSVRSRPTPAVPLADVQAPIRERLEDVKSELRRIVDDDSPLIAGVSHHLLGMKGKLFRPTLVLLSSAATDHSPADGRYACGSAGADAPGHTRARRCGGPFGASAGDADAQCDVQPPDLRHCRRFPVSSRVARVSRLGDLQALRVLTEASVEMTRGELRQLTYGDPLEFGERDYEALIGGEDGGRCSAPRVRSVHCAAAAEYRAELARYGERLGMAFQVIDDVLDYTSDHEVTGKPGGLDLRERKMTLPLIAAMREMGAAGRSQVEALFAAEVPSEGDIHAVIALVAEYGGICLRAAPGAFYAQEAEQAICRDACHPGRWGAPSRDCLCPRPAS